MFRQNYNPLQLQMSQMEALYEAARGDAERQARIRKQRAWQAEFSDDDIDAQIDKAQEDEMNKDVI